MEARLYKARFDARGYFYFFHVNASVLAAATDSCPAEERKTLGLAASKYASYSLADPRLGSKGSRSTTKAKQREG